MREGTVVCVIPPAAMGQAPWVRPHHDLDRLKVLVLDGMGSPPPGLGCDLVSQSLGMHIATGEIVDADRTNPGMYDD